MKQFENAVCCEECYFFHEPFYEQGYKLGYCSLWSTPRSPLYTPADATCSDCMKEKKRGQYTATTAPIVHSPNCKGSVNNGK